jgi:HlyD family secretion protein
MTFGTDFVSRQFSPDALSRELRSSRPATRPMMKFLLKLTVVLAVLLALLIGGGAAAYYGWQYWKARNKPEFRTAEVVRGEIVWVVNATGTLQPKLRVSVGSVVSGPIVKLNADYNDEVKKVDPDEELSDEEKEKRLLAKIDPQRFLAAKRRDEAALNRAEAEIRRVGALRDQARSDYGRALRVQEVSEEEEEEFISETELDQYMYNYWSLEAQLAVAWASYDQAKANLEDSEANLGYTKIYSPVDGIVIDRKIDEGQTLAAQFQAPELFVVAPDMDKEMYVYASVDEADIGKIRKAQQSEQPVFFTVDAYPEDLFEGKIHQIRKNPNTVQNVVTYPVVVTTPNPKMKLLPGMTADLSFQIEKRDQIVKIPNAALRFYPEEKNFVREEDQKILEGVEEEEDSEKDQDSGDLRSAMQRILTRKERKKRHVWVKEGEKLKAVEITVGLSDFKYTEMESGDLEEGQELVTGLKKKS